MKEVKIPTSDSWHDALIESLKDSQRSSGYLSVALEPENPDPKLLLAVIQDVIEAHLKISNLSEQAKIYHQQLEKMFSENGAKEIYTLIALLNELGFILEVKPKEAEQK
jgi:DNA-binding phage protein